ncbi:peptidase M18, aminopeptidase I [Lizonia empirigonia]|nr:peptidase M18, aminopeptidase I [Lizonia empirigonia]
MTKNHPALRKAASNADLYADPAPLRADRMGCSGVRIRLRAQRGAMGWGERAGYKKLSERDAWDLQTGGKYYVDRNGTSLIAFAIGDKFEAGNGAAILRNKAGYVQLGVAPYAGALSDTWWDRDLGIGGRVLVREHGKIVTKLVKLDWPIARIPTLAPHFGAAANGPFNRETQMVPIIGLDNSDIAAPSASGSPARLGVREPLPPPQPERLVKAISSELGITDYSTIINWELELFDVQPATTGGLDREFIFAGRIDDKLCSWAAIQALLNSDATSRTRRKFASSPSSTTKNTMSRIIEEFAPTKPKTALARTYANSFLVSSDVIHAVNPTSSTPTSKTTRHASTRDPPSPATQMPT